MNIHLIEVNWQWLINVFPVCWRPPHLHIILLQKVQNMMYHDSWLMTHDSHKSCSILTVSVSCQLLLLTSLPLCSCICCSRTCIVLECRAPSGFLLNQPYISPKFENMNNFSGVSWSKHAYFACALFYSAWNKTVIYSFYKTLKVFILLRMY